MSDAFPARRGVEVPDSWLEENKNNPNAIYWIVPPNAADKRSEIPDQFRPRGIVIDGDNSGDSSHDFYKNRDVTQADVRGILFDENEKQAHSRKPRTLATHVEHPRAYKAIWAYGTTARGIEINA